MKCQSAGAALATGQQEHSWSGPDLLLLCPCPSTDSHMLHGGQEPDSRACGVPGFSYLNVHPSHFSRKVMEAKKKKVNY